MNIWLINHYAVPPKYYPLARTYLFAKNLIAMGHSVTIFAASSVHNSDKNLITGDEPYKTECIDGVEYVYIKCRTYNGNGLQRILNMCEFAQRLPKVCKHFLKPDVVVATSVTPIACAKGLRIAHKYGVSGIAEIADLWPETLVSYGMVNKHNPAVFALRMIEKWIYKKSDAIVFTMEGAYDYIIERKWTGCVPKEKVFYINNGIELDNFMNNQNQNQISDLDLSDPSLFKVVYTGAIRKVNNLGLLLDAAKEITDDRIKILIWGDGDECEALKERKQLEKIDNVEFKGKVEKKYVPYITSCADLNIAHNTGASVLRFGISFNKIFDYMAAGKPILVDFQCNYNPVIETKCGKDIRNQTAEEIAGAIMSFSAMKSDEYNEFCQNAVLAAEQYDFGRLTQKLLEVIEYANKKKK